jgi:hypothetical protein
MPGAHKLEQEVGWLAGKNISSQTNYRLWRATQPPNNAAERKNSTAYLFRKAILPNPKSKPFDQYNCENGIILTALRHERMPLVQLIVPRVY